MALGRTPHENYSYAYNNSVGQHYVTMLSNYIGPYPLEKLERHSRKDQRKVQVSRPSLIKTYNNAVGGVNLLMQQLKHMGHRSREEVVVATSHNNTRCSGGSSMEHLLRH